MVRCVIVWMREWHSMWAITENKDRIGGEESLNLVWKYGLCFWQMLSMTWGNTEDMPEGHNWTRHPIRPHVRLAGGSLVSAFCGFFSQGFSKSLNVLYVIVRVCSPSVTAWTFAKQSSKLSHLISSLSTHRAKTTLGPSVLCFVRYYPSHIWEILQRWTFYLLLYVCWLNFLNHSRHNT